MISYLITDPNFYTNNPDKFSEIFIKNIQNYKVNFACFRDKQSCNYKEIAPNFIQICKKNNIKSFLHSDVNLAIQLNSFGVHLPSSKLSFIKKAKEAGLFTIASTHNLEEVKLAQDQKVDAVTLSPIFYSPNKSQALGLVKLKEIIDKISIHVYALGGISNYEQICACKNAGAKGFAAIRFFARE